MLWWFWSNSNQNKDKRKIQLKNLSFYSVKPAGADQENLSPIAGVILTENIEHTKTSNFFIHDMF